MNMALEQVNYPPPPWQLGGLSWMGLFTASQPAILPVYLKHLLNPHKMVVAVIRYLSGILTYDELIIASVARRGLRCGLYVHHIWVDDLTSLWGGRQIWGLNKELAQFNWQGNSVQVTDQQGLIAELTLDLQPSSWPKIWLPVPSFGCVEGQWLFTVGSLYPHLATAGMTVNQWSARFPYQIIGQPQWQVASKPFEMTFNAPTYLNS